ncbi:MAG: hypothetical protein JXD22_01865 [Sedimentisphaerales bacterium]|nr:hypothetical protein [Sedimentisphaerales bacterium]
MSNILCFLPAVANRDKPVLAGVTLARPAATVRQHGERALSEAGSALICGFISSIQNLKFKIYNL